MITIKAGRPAIELVKFCYRADCSLIFEGEHGIGKSKLIERAAKDLEIKFAVFDLSLMEPPDLVGIPYIVEDEKHTGEKVTKYATPSSLPRSGKGLLMFEELNRAPEHVRAPCLQLLTARTLNDYRLPPGWLPMAAINPANEDYQVQELDPALTSRFVVAKLVADVHEWLIWAEGSNVHPAVIQYVKADPTVFDDGNPRSWTDVSKLLNAAASIQPPADVLRVAIAGKVGDKRAVAFLKTLKLGKGDLPLVAEEIIKRYSAHRPSVQRWIKGGHLDLVESTLRNVLVFLQPEIDYAAVTDSSQQWANLGAFFADLPGDLQESARDFFVDRGYKFPKVTTKRKAS